MYTLDRARSRCEALLPGLLGKLAEVPLLDWEQPGNPGLDLFRGCGGPGLVIPKEYGGLGGSAADAVEVLRAIGAASPSLAVATAMHHFSLASLFAVTDTLEPSPEERALLAAIADQNLLVASGFAEGRPGQGVLSPLMTGVRDEGGIRVSGAKKPCSMSRSMDLFSASVAVPTENGGSELKLMLVPAATPGVSVHPFWQAPVLTGAESDEVRLEDVFVDDRLLVDAEIGDGGELDALQTVGFIWFEVLITSCYLGMASALAERAFADSRRGTELLSALGVRLETAALLLDSVARRLVTDEPDNRLLTLAVTARYGAQDAITDAVALAVEALGGIAFIGGQEVAYLATATRCVTFHPPTRVSTHAALAAALRGGVLRLS
ncbi:acyl-CoA dehydrogenase family protein [Nocardia terpenica]|uniref:Oxidoreductase n=1 Tax=Nocardia terpenica TaxID=455432 RepID=A0A291RGI9_9NOCA|nr:acyl-CoA dehydrogenase family protein [Nocardia terpenica]ATL66420.1 oxidoreductase [Nocardia terpenica]